MDEIDSSYPFIGDPMELTAVRLLQDDIVAYLMPMFPYRAEGVIRDSVLRQSRLLADPLDQNRLTNSCIDELLNPASLPTGSETRAGPTGGYIDLTQDAVVPKATTVTEGVIDLNVMPDLFEVDPAKGTTDVNRNIKSKPSSDLNRNNCGRPASVNATGFELTPEANEALVVNAETWESSPRTKEVDTRSPDSSVVASEVFSVNIQDVSTGGAPDPLEAAHKLGSSPKLDAPAVSSVGQRQAWETPAGGAGTTLHRQKPSPAPSTMSRCPCNDCQQNSESSLGSDPLHRPWSSHQGPRAPLAASQSVRPTGSPGGQADSFLETRRTGPVCSSSTAPRVGETSSPVGAPEAANSRARATEEKRQDLASLTGKTRIDGVKQETAAKPQARTSETLELFFESLLKGASSKSSPKPGGSKTSLPGMQTFSSLSSPAVSAAAAASTSGTVDFRRRSDPTPQPSTSASGCQTPRQPACATTKTNQTCDPRLYEKPSAGPPAATYSSSTKPAAASARPTVSLPSPLRPAFEPPRAKPPSLPLYQVGLTPAHFANKQPTPASSAAGTLAGTSHQKPLGPAVHRSFASPLPANFLPAQELRMNPGSAEAGPSNVRDRPAHAAASKSASQRAASAAAIASASTTLGPPSRFPLADQATTQTSALGADAAVLTAVPKPQPQKPPQLHDVAVHPPGHIPPPFMPNAQAQPVMRPAAFTQPPVPFHHPRIQLPRLAVPLVVAPPHAPDTEQQPVIHPAIPAPPPDPVYQPPQAFPVAENEPGNVTSVEEMKAEVLVLFPEADPAYVLSRLGEMKGYPAPVNQVCNHLLETPSYPRAKKQEASAKPTKSQAEGEKVDYINDYYKLPVVAYRYFGNVEMQMQNDFRMLSVDTVRTFLHLHFCNYAPARVCLEEILRTDSTIQELLPRVKKAKYHERKIRVQVATKTRWGEELRSEVAIQLLKGLRHLHPKSNIKETPELTRQIDCYQQYVKNSALEKDLLLALNMNENEYEAEGQLIECGCCYAEVTFEKMIQCLDGHLFCESCLQMYTKQAVYGQGKALLMCMTDGCDSSYPRDQLEKVLSSTDMAKYDERVQEESIQLASVDGLVRCPHCDFAAVLDPGDKVFSCQNTDCLKETCRHCGEDWKEHFGKRCEEVEKKSETNIRLSYEERMSQLQIRTCHRCKTGIMKDQGCNKMTCRCGAKMCYICRKPNIDYNHFCSHARNPGQGCTQCTQCSLWTDPAEDDARAVKELEKELKKEREKLARAKDSRDRLGPTEFAPEAKKQRVV